MFTVIIAEKEMLSGFDKYRLFLEPLLRNSSIAFCEWNREAKSLEAMVPELYDLVSKQKEWRAIVVNPAGRQQKNPFDYIGPVAEMQELTTGLKGLSKKREKLFGCYEKATENALMKLLFALSGNPSFNTSFTDQELFEETISDETKIYELMLKQQLDHLDMAVLLKGFESYSKESLLRYVSKKDYPAMLRFLAEKDSKKILKMIGVDNIIPFIKMIGGDDPRFTDPEYLELILENTKKDSLLKQLLPAFAFHTVEPTEVICLALRTYDSESYNQKVRWMALDEQEYSRFTECNLYPDKARYIVFDVRENKHKQFEYDLLRFLSFILVLGTNAIPPGVLTKQRVYLADCENDVEDLSALLSAYDSKLWQTIRTAKENQAFLQQKDKETVSSDNFIKVLETTVTVPLEADKKKEGGSLKINPRPVGLGRNCPQDEESYVEGQYKEVHKELKEFLKLPRRSLIQAVESMSGKNRIDDEEAMYLNQFQIEDLVEDIDLAEQRMVSTVTVNIYDIAKYTKKMESAKKRVNQCIDTRMTREAAFKAGLIALLAFFLSFAPLFVSSVNTIGSITSSLIITGIMCGCLAIIGFICLFSLRRELVRTIDGFNQVMGRIVSEVHGTMGNFSAYLTNACKMMRGYSVLNRIEEAEKVTSRKVRIIEKHIQDMERQREEYRALFSEIGLSQEVDFSEIEGYEYDFTILTDYSYGLPFEEHATAKIEFLQVGNTATIPVNYIKAITLVREEIFDV